MRFTQDREGLWRYRRRICVPRGNGLRDRISEEAHKGEFIVHPRISKMYRDLKKMFCRPRMNSGVAEFMSKCLAYHKVKIEHQKPSKALQTLEIPKWKWESILMDFVMELPRKPVGYDTIWVIMDRLTKSAHFLLIKANYPLEKLAQLYIQEIVRLHGVSSTIILDWDPRFTSRFWGAL